MQGNPQVIEYFKNLLRGELAARDQYFIHSRIYEDQGLVKMYTRLTTKCRKKPSTPTRCCAASFLGGMPDMRPNPFTPAPRWWRCCKRPGRGIRSARCPAKGMELCESVRDYVSRDLLLASCATPRKTTPTGWKSNWSDRKMGLPNYLQSQSQAAAWP